MSRPVVVVVGSLHYDIMVEAPDLPRKGETVAGFAWHPKFGGKGGNQALASADAGADVRIVGAVGDDAFGLYLLEVLNTRNIDTSRVTRYAGQPSGMSVAISDADGDYGAVIVSGANALIDPGLMLDAELYHGATMLLLQNEIPEELNLAAAHAAKSRGLEVCLNAAPYRSVSSALMSLVDLLVVNAVEAEDFCGLQVTDLASAQAAGMALIGMVPSVVVTAGASGVVGIQRGGPPVILPAEAVQVVSTHGAGDVFVGTLAVSLARTRTFASSLERANQAAARHVSGQTRKDPGD